MINVELLDVHHQSYDSQISPTPISSVDVSNTLVHAFIVNSTFLYLIGPPLVEVDLTFRFDSLSTSVSVSSNNCDSTRTNVDDQCMCKMGSKLDWTGTCEDCRLNTYSDDYSYPRCFSCPTIRITKQIGSTNVSDCLCPGTLFDNGDYCTSCPKFGTCDHGSLVSLRNGYKFDHDSGETTSCPLRYACRNNACSFNTKGNLCADCVDNTIRLGFVCLGNDVVSIVIGIAVLIVIFTALFLRHHITQYSEKRFKTLFARYPAMSLPREWLHKMVESRSVVCPFRLFIAISVLFSGSSVLITVPVSFAASVFGNFFGFVILLIYFVTSYILIKRKQKQELSFNDGYFVSFCLIIVFVGLCGKYLSGSLDLESYLLVPLFFYGCYLKFFYCWKSSFPLFVIILLTFISLLPYGFFLPLQSVILLFFFLFSSFINAILSCISLVVSVILLVRHYFSYVMSD
ncbi:hypothetical protein GEMRC1_000324 [Eukaryota sp. GEM-RC1]